jgi:hypothetical protein
MKRITSAKFLAAGVVAFGAFMAASAAHARSDVYFSIGVQSPVPVYVEPAPVYVQPRPVYVEPAPVYVQPRPVYVEPQPIYVQPRPVYVAPRPVYVAPQPIYYGHSGQYRNEHRHGHRFGPNGDFDLDGIRNQDDRDRDGDGVRNRHDRFPDSPNRY